MSHEIYLDNNATTYLADTAWNAMKLGVEMSLGNPSSEHRSGEKARKAVVKSRDLIAEMLGAPPQNVLFASGVTELNYWVLNDVLHRSPTPHLVTTKVEHSCVLETAKTLEAEGVRVTYLPVGNDGRIDLSQLSNAVKNQASLVSVQWVNNETGVMQPVHEIAKICHEAEVPFHCDAAQATGKVNIQFSSSSIDYLTVSAHKMHGPTGVGAVCLKNRSALTPMLRGGSQEYGLRPGTENTLGIIGFGAAASDLINSLDTTIAYVANLRNHFEKLVLSSLSNVSVNGSTTDRVCNSSNLLFSNIDGAAIVALLDRQGIRCSQSSACTSNYPEPSYVLRAMGLSEEQAFASVRFSFSKQNTMSEVDIAVTKLIAVVERLSGLRSQPSTHSNLPGEVKHEV